MKYWLRRRDIPTTCPKCGAEAHKPEGKPTLNDLLKTVYGGPSAHKQYDTFWKMNRWVLSCGACAMMRAPILFKL